MATCPEVRQCQLLDPDQPNGLHWQFGTIAVQGPNGLYGAMHPTNGGHWETADAVADWAVISEAHDVPEPEGVTHDGAV